MVKYGEAFPLQERHNASHPIYPSSALPGEVVQVIHVKRNWKKLTIRPQTIPNPNHPKPHIISLRTNVLLSCLRIFLRCYISYISGLVFGEFLWARFCECDWSAERERKPGSGESETKRRKKKKEKTDSLKEDLIRREKKKEKRKEKTKRKH